MNSETCIVGALQFRYQSQVYDVLERSMEKNGRLRLEINKVG